MKIGALQTGYLPWLGFFDQVYRCDLFVIYDDLQYTRKDWRNRNRIKTAQGILWLTVPVRGPGLLRKKIRDVEIANHLPWRRQHWKALLMNYSRAPFFELYRDFFRRLYKSPCRYLASLNREIILYCLDSLGINTPVVFSSEAGLESGFQRRFSEQCDATDRIIYLCHHYGADTFLEGSSGRNYVDERRLRQASIDIVYHDYSHPVYRQLYGPFIPYLSIVDLLFNHGPNSLAILAGRSDNVATKQGEAEAHGPIRHRTGI